MTKLERAKTNYTYLAILLVLSVVIIFLLNFDFSILITFLQILGTAMLLIGALMSVVTIPKLRYWFFMAQDNKKEAKKKSVGFFTPFLNEVFIFETTVHYWITTMLLSLAIILFILYIMPLNFIGIDTGALINIKVTLLMSSVLFFIGFSISRGIAYISLQNDIYKELKELSGTTWIEKMSWLTVMVYFIPILRISGLVNLTEQLKRVHILAENKKSLKIKRKEL